MMMGKCPHCGKMVDMEQMEKGGDSSAMKGDERALRVMGEKMDGYAKERMKKQRMMRNGQ